MDDNSRIQQDLAGLKDSSIGEIGSDVLSINSAIEDIERLYEDVPSDPKYPLVLMVSQIFLDILELFSLFSGFNFTGIWGFIIWGAGIIAGIWAWFWYFFHTNIIKRYIRKKLWIPMFLFFVDKLFNTSLGAIFPGSIMIHLVHKDSVKHIRSVRELFGKAIENDSQVIKRAGDKVTRKALKADFAIKRQARKIIAEKAHSGIHTYKSAKEKIKRAKTENEIAKEIEEKYERLLKIENNPKIIRTARRR